MTTYRTGNAIGSADPRDLYDNAENLDELVNSQDKAEHPDRLGVSRKTWYGMEADFQAFLQSSGYQDLGDYAPGIEITARNQVIRADGELWRLSASVDLPYTTTGAGMPEGGAFVAVGDAVLRQDLANPDKGAAMVGFRQGGTGAIPMTLGEVLGRFLSVSQFGVTGDGSDEHDKFQRALDFSELSNTPLSLDGLTITTRGGHTFTGTMIAGGATLRRVSGYTGNQSILALGHSSEIHGKLRFDGNFPSEDGEFSDSFASLEVVGDGVRIDSLELKNTPMYTQKAKQLHGCSVYGDDFFCGEVKGNLCGYRTLGLRMVDGRKYKSFHIGRFESRNHHYKGFTINGSLNTYITDVHFDNFIAATPDDFAHNASEGLLVDANPDNRVMYVRNMHIGHISISGGRANCLKVENVETFSCGHMNLDVTTTLAVGQAMRMEALNFFCDAIVFNKNKLRFRGLNVSVGSVLCTHPVAGDVAYIWLEGLLPSGEDVSVVGNRNYSFGDVIAMNDNATLYLFRLDIKQSVTYRLRIDNIDANYVSAYLANFDVDNGGLERIRDGVISIGSCNDRSKGHLYNDPQRWIDFGSREFYARTPSPPTTGTFRAGDYLVNSQPTIQGTAPNQYIVKGWVCSTGGSDGAFVFSPDRVSPP